MAEAETKRPWYRRKRWWAAGLLWLAIAYPLSAGPAGYAVGRLWLDVDLVSALYRPVLPDEILYEGGGPRHVLGRYYLRWFYAGAAADGVVGVR